MAASQTQAANRKKENFQLWISIPICFEGRTDQLSHSLKENYQSDVVCTPSTNRSHPIFSNREAELISIYGPQNQNEDLGEHRMRLFLKEKLNWKKNKNHN